MSVTSETPAFLDVSAAEMTAWRELPVTKAFLDWLRFEQEHGRRTVTDLVYANRIEDSRIQVGLVTAIENILERTVTPAAMPEPPPETEEKYRDPATRPSIRRNDADR